jgi:hypothetical protein
MTYVGTTYACNSNVNTCSKNADIVSGEEECFKTLQKPIKLKD